MPTPMIAVMLLGPLLPPDPGFSRLWSLFLWPFTLPAALILGALEAVFAAPIVAVAVVSLWWGAGAVPPDWSAGRGRLALLLGGAGAFGAAGVGRRFLAEHVAGAGGVMAFRPAVLPYVALGAVAGACLAEARAASGPTWGR